MADGDSEIGAQVKAAHLAKKAVEQAEVSNPAALALKMQKLFVEQAEKLNTIHDFLADAKAESEKQRGELARAASTIQKLRDEVLVHRQVIEEVKTLARDALTLERQRLAKERDAEHQEYLRGKTSEPRRPELQALVDHQQMKNIFERLDKIDEGLRATGRIIDPPKAIPASVEQAANAPRSEIDPKSLAEVP